jgi:hypothetical protein
MAKPTPNYVGNWGNYMCDASRNSVSKDQLVGPPNALRWFGGPTARNAIGGPRTSDATFLQVNGPYRHVDHSRGARTLPWAPVEDKPMLWARDVNSGVLLWYRVLTRLPQRLGGPAMPTVYSTQFSESFVAAGGRVYIYDFTSEKEVALTALNIRTGKVERVFDQSVVIRKADLPEPQPDAKGRKPDWRIAAHDTFADTTVLVHGKRVVQTLWDELFVMDADTGEIRWKINAPAGTDFWKALMAGDRLITVRVKAREKRALGYRDVPCVAIEAWGIEDGKALWQFTDLGSATISEDARRCDGWGASGDHVLIHLRGGRGGKGQSTLLLNARDGKLIWDRYMDQWTLGIIGDQIWGSTSTGGSVWDLATGKPLFHLGSPNTGNCSVGCGTANFWMGKKVFFPVALGGTVGGRSCPFYYMRTITETCGENLCPSYGSVYNIAPVCPCEMAINATQAWYAQKPTIAVADEMRLLKGGGAPSGRVERQSEGLKFPGAFDWGFPEAFPEGVFWHQQYRAAGRKARYWSGYAMQQTKPVRAGDVTLVAHVQEHRLEAARGEKTLWNFVAGGRIGSPPVVHQGLAIFGCHDGYVYAVNLADGAPAWRFLAAPADRRHVAMNQVESAWPVFGVALDAGKLYFSAGRHAELDGGVHFYCLDPAAGKMEWHVQYLSGLSSDKYTPRKLNRGAPIHLFDPEREKRIINDVVQVRDGKVWVFEKDVVDLACPRDTVINPHTLIPIWLGPEKPDIAALTKRLDDPDPAVACDAAWALKRAGPITETGTAAKVFSTIVRALKETDNLQVHLMAAEALKGLGPLSAERPAAVEGAMVEAAPKRHPHAFPLLAEVVKDMGDPGVKAVRSAMMRALPAVRNPDLFVWMVPQLREAGPDGVNVAVSAVIQALKGTDVCLFEAAAGQVKDLGADGVKQAVPLLEKAAGQKDARIAKAAADALILLGRVPPK